MMDSAYKFLLVGNGSYENKGCEAIVRGSKVIIDTSFPKSSMTILDLYKTKPELETDEEIGHICSHYPRWSSGWLREQIKQRILKRKYPSIWQKDKIYATYDFFLSVGGDNYSLDYGKLQWLVDLDEYIFSFNKPFIIWGASIGPFESDEGYKALMLEHFKKMTLILAREDETVTYLADNGVYNNVRRVSDPGFLMLAKKPKNKEINIPNGSIGLNFSPLMAKYWTNGDQKCFQNMIVRSILNLAEETSRPIILIPHVISQGFSDYDLLSSIRKKILSLNKKVIMLPPTLSAAETKYLVGKLSCFVGARTHATIAAMSMCVPTVSLSYSMKAKGINKDVFGHDEFVLPPERFTAEKLSESVKYILLRADEIRKELNEKIPLVKKRALDAGKYLKDLLGS